jgi:Trypsin-like peptidase domain
MKLREETLKAILTNKKLKEAYLTHLERISIQGRIGKGADSMTVAAIKALFDHASPDSAPVILALITEAAQDELVEFGMAVASIKDDKPDLRPNQPIANSKYWVDILKHRPHALKEIIRAVGRLSIISGVDNPVNEPIGTAWCIAPGVLVTSRHVAAFFANSSDFSFNSDDRGNTMSALIDFKKEEQNSSIKREISIEKVIYMDPVVDVAFLKLTPPHRNVVPIHSLELDATAIVDVRAAVIGYPTEDDHQDRNLSNAFFSSYGFKKIACGHVLAFSEQQQKITHSCPTLLGNSGSPLINLETGKILGIHYGGNWSAGNYAVSAAEIKRVLDKHA